MKIRIALPLVIVLVASVASASTAQEDGWVAQSDRNAEVLLDVMARFNPEGAAFLGIEGLDEEVLQLPADRDARQIEAIGSAVCELRARFEKESDPRVRLDLEILIDSAEFNIRQIRLNREHLLPYLNLPQMIFGGVRALLDEQSSPEQRAAVAIRLRRYTGVEYGFTPLTAQAEALISSRLPNPGLVGPFRGELERDLSTSDRFIVGIRELLAAYEVPDCDQVVDVLEAQVRDYNAFLRAELLPRARQDFHQPAEIYTQLLEAIGVDMPVDELERRAHVAFREIQNEMQVIAALVAEELDLDDIDYRSVIRHLKRDQFVGDGILTTYTARIAKLETIIQARSVVTLPRREMRIRLASEAESAAIPSPFMLPPRLIGNTGEMGEFVLPFRPADDDAGDSNRVDDYTFEATSWTLAVHEGRPGHELAVLLHDRKWRVFGAQRLRLQQCQRRRLGALLRGRNEALFPARGAAGFIAAEAPPRGPRLSRPRDAERRDQPGRGPSDSSKMTSCCRTSWRSRKSTATPSATPPRPRRTSAATSG